MATIGNDPGGFKRILFVAPDGKRKTIRLGKATMKQANAFKVKVEALIGQTITGVADDEVSRWLAGLDATMYGRLAAVGLVKPRECDGQTLGALIDGYIAGRKADAKPRTLINLDQARKRLLAFFGADKPLRDITEADAEEFYRHQLAEGLAPNTVRRTCGRAKQFLRFAVRKRLLPSNPFAELKTTVGGNPDRKFFVTAEAAGKVVDACPDGEWRLIFALCRWGASAARRRFWRCAGRTSIGSDPVLPSAAGRPNTTTARTAASCPSSRSCCRTWSTPSTGPSRAQSTS
jgi:hypothetical protein